MMKPAGAYSSHAARVLGQISSDMPADDALREEFRRSRRLTAEQRRDISRAVFAYFRWLQWLDRRDTLLRQVEAALELQCRFDTNPACIKSEALAARAVPEWLKNEMDEIPLAWLRQLQREPALWLRAKSGKIEQLARELGNCAPPPATGRAGLLATCLRYTGSHDLFRTAAFHKGLFEIQDLASQLVGHACAPQPGETWWDACAGEGGKMLHLSDLMQNKGLLWASDRSARRLALLKRRAARAQVYNYRAAPWDGSPRLPTKTKFDGVLVDAPCSGIGTWQRNPHARWTTFPHDVRELAAVQGRLLDHASAGLKPGGRLVYAVCTLARAETTAVADAFASAHPNFEATPIPLPVGIAHPVPAGPSALVLWPHEHNANGMFIATWRRK
ncbi:MAG: RsmB/NOP family class I SAM-dependent RNA methyltransferase [Opitutaceae bacterium]|nr:RsmB/NOP family class I SAM-dependent RNA methyltransferase [Opitutaceae bacterium]